MKIQKPNISNQISIEQITKCCNDDIKHFTEHFFQLEFTWLHNAYGAFKDFDKYLILVYLINNTLKTYKEHFYNLSFENFYKSESFEIEKISIIEIVKDLSMSKETVRRKINELNKSRVIIRNKKQILIINPFKFQKPINNIKELSKLITCISLKLKKIYGLPSYNDKYFLELIKKNYTRYWHTFLNFQLKYLFGVKKSFGSIANFFIFGSCVVNQSYNLKNAPQNASSNLLEPDNYIKLLTNYTKYRAQGLNPTTISELTGVPRASVIRKLKELSKDKFLLKNKQNLFTVITAKESPAAFKKLSNNFEKNQLLLRYCLKDLFNYMVV